MICPKCNQDVDRIYAIPEALMICLADNVTNTIQYIY